jgi:uncharacterized protein YndB with AHSA1/START domain
VKADRIHKASNQEQSEYGIATAKDTVRFERLLPGPIERVWSYLTEPEKRKTWFAGGEMELRVGGKVELIFRHSEFAPEPTPDRFQKYDGLHSYGRITHCEPPRVLSYTWSEETGGDSEVTFELTPEGNDVRLVLTHRRLADRATMLGVAGGWHSHLAVLSDRLSGREPRAFWSIHAKAEEEYKKRLAGK